LGVAAERRAIESSTSTRPELAARAGVKPETIEERMLSGLRRLAQGSTSAEYEDGDRAA